MGRENISYRDYSIPLSAGVPYLLNVGGDYYQVITCTGSITLEFDQGVKLNREQGMGGPVSYSGVMITSSIDQTVVLSLGNTDGRVPYDSRATLNGAVVNVTERVANTLTPKVDAAVAAAATQTLAAADATRMALWVTIPLVDTAGNLIVSNNGCRIGDSSVDATRGTEVFPGDTVRIPGTMRVDLYNGTGVEIKPHVMAERYV